MNDLQMVKENETTISCASRIADGGNVRLISAVRMSEMFLVLKIHKRCQRANRERKQRIQPR